MKCVCGYEHEQGLDGKGNWQEFLKGDEYFDVLCGDFRVYAHKNGNQKEDTKLFVCPKCSTVKASKYY